MIIQQARFGFFGLVLAVASLVPLSGPAQHRSSGRQTGITRQILGYINDFRRSRGLPALLANSYISSIALGHSKDMLTGKSPFGHDGFRLRVDEIRKRLGRLHVAAENVASGPMGAREVVDGWLHSPGHRLNIEGDFRLTGIGVATAANGMVYFTEIFVR